MTKKMDTLTRNASTPVSPMRSMLVWSNSYCQMLAGDDGLQLSNSGTNGMIKSADMGAVYSCNCSAEQSRDRWRVPAPI